MRRAMRSPFARSLVHTEAPRPKFESLARSSASASSLTTITGTTGPKIGGVAPPRRRALSLEAAPGEAGAEVPPLQDPVVPPAAGAPGRRKEAPAVPASPAGPAVHPEGARRERVVDQPGHEVGLVG